MSDGTKIEWTDATWNVVNGCSVVSPGCTNCYAMRLAGTRLRNHPSRAGLTVDSKAGPVWTGETRFNEAVLLDPLKWQRPRRIFVCAHGDLFHDDVGEDTIDQVFAAMALAPQHVFQVLTKRPQRMREYMLSIDNGNGERLDGFRSALVEGMAQKIHHERTGDDSVDLWLAVHLPLPNVWLGVSVEDQARADERIPLLLNTPAAKRWLSCEPLLGPVDLTEWLGLWEPSEQIWTPGGGSFTTERPRPPAPLLDWIVAGGESGPGARPMHPDWPRLLRDQCAAAGVPFLFKQWGDWLGGGPDRFEASNCRGLKNWGDERFSVLVGKRAAGRQLDGVQHDGFPA